ncbi:PKD domain-containing protein [Nakamurella sp. PAMC28650]|uniref:PKD domain-containing protein n=1 Tax=Nakamurella sp. PAMC28650 TaxID=2762325 RepID=UPI0021040C73|nr:PKD domain-containing protein [Nakamurella sp. PAMC28650]
MGTTVALVAAGLLVTVVAAVPAAAAPTAAAAISSGLSPTAPRTSNLATADALPTVQIDGVAWSQAIVGSSVWVVGGFANARPAGSAAGSNNVARNNILVYTLSTGNLVTSIVPYLNAPGYVVAASPDGTRVYVGGDFTSANGQTHQRIAAYNASTGAIIGTFTASVDARVKSIVATNTTVYVGGSFQNANGTPRAYVAAFTAATGALTSWNPGADSHVAAMVMAPDQSKLIIGGQFQNVGGLPNYGMAAVDPVNGGVLPWNATQKVRDAGANASILGLTTDGTYIYGNGYVFGSGGNLEGTFQADMDGNVQWIEDCHGDTYGNFVTNNTVYTVSHAHYCGNIGGFPQTNPWTPHRSLAFTTNATGTIGHDPYGYFDWFGNVSPSIVDWFPNLVQGTYTGQGQAAWTITGNSQYIIEGGEFPSVNGVAQQGLVRFAVGTPNKVGPEASQPTLVTSVVSLSAGTARVAWQTTNDRDDLALTYKVVRDGKTATPIYTTTANSTFWNQPSIGFTDTGLAPGSTHSYRVYAYDPAGNSAVGSTKTVTIATAGANSAFANDVISAGASHFWRLGESSGTVGYDWAAYDDLTLNSAVTRVGGGSQPEDTSAAAFDGSSGFAVNGSAVQAPDTFTEAAWFQTTSTSGGKILGYGNATTGNSSSYDRHIYMDAAGHLYFGVYTGALVTISTTGTFNDGQWHQVVGSMSSAGMAFYVDGKRVGTTSTTVGQSYVGYWRVGGDSSWNDNPYLAGTIDEVAIYPSALSLAQVRQQFVDSGRSLPGATAPADPYGAAVYNSSPDVFYRMDETSGTSATDLSGNSNAGVYSGGETFGTASNVGAPTGTAVTFNGIDGTLSSTNQVNAPSVYSEEAWFNTSTTHGGKIIGFGDQQKGNSGNYDRHIYMLNNGQLVFGTYTGTLNLAQTAGSYNDSKWHHVVATQGADGMKLYVDSVLVATNVQTQAQGYAGYWRVGGDSDWGGDSPYFAGAIDEAAAYSVELTSAQVSAHYNASAAANKAPTASFTSTATNLSVAFNGSASADPDGTIASYSWDFGDSTSSTAVSPTHLYTAAGTYTVVLTVTDNQGATGTKSVTITVTTPPNVAPTASFTSTATNLSVAFNGSASADPDGTIASYSWDFGDSTSSTAVSPTHLYTAAGTYTVVLTVTDNQGATGTKSVTITVTTPPNVAPTASFTSTATNLSVAFNGSASADPDGTIASYSWDFGDSTSSTAVSPTHLYTAAGTYTVVLTVTDNQGATGTKSATITVTTAANQSPIAAFTSTFNGLSPTFDGTSSNDPDGTIASYAWTFGDSTTGTGPSITHNYTAAGTYSVGLTVTDNLGATNTKTASVVVSLPAPFVTDAFGRTSTSGWGTANLGGNWTSVGTAANITVNGSVGKIVSPTAGASAGTYLGATARTSTDLTATVAADKVGTGGGTYVYVVGRRVSTNNEYRARVRFAGGGKVGIALTSLKGSSTDVTLATEVLLTGTFAANQVFNVRFDVVGTGTTTLKLKVWAAGTAEPAAWQLSSSDGFAGLQAAGAVGFTTYVSSSSTNAPVTVSIGSLNARPAGA